MATGTVKMFDAARRFGFIRPDEGGPDIFVHVSALAGEGSPTLEINQRVSYEQDLVSGRPQARNVRPLVGSHEPSPSTAALSTLVASMTSSAAPDATELDEDLEALDTSKVRVSLLEEIANWKREAKAEDNDRYFWHVREVDQIARGGKYFVIGRKGSGKTALCEYFDRLSNHDTFSEKLSFKNFPFNMLYSQSNPQYTPPNQFISIWKYLIYSTVCRLMLQNQAVPSTVRDQLTRLYKTDSPLGRRVEEWVGKEFGVSVLGLSVKVARRGPRPDPENWMAALDYLEDFLLEHAGDATYYVLFDELDEDYRDLVAQEQYQQYTALMTSLFKAVQDIRTTFSRSGAPRVYPVVFLRDDIYELVQDSDKNKWGDFRVDLNWDEAKIRQVIAFRISRALDSTCEVALPFEEAWSSVFGTRSLKIGSRKRKPISTFDFIARSTLLRPRDFVAYLQNCAQHALEHGGGITPEVVKTVDKGFSNYLKDELVDELFAVLPDIQMILDVISHLRKWNFTIAEFEGAYAASVDRGFIKETNVKLVLQVLYLFSVIGNQIKVGRYAFRYQNREARLNFKERLVVHRGLFKALQII